MNSEMNSEINGRGTCVLEVAIARAHRIEYSQPITVSHAQQRFKEKILSYRDQRISKDGIIIIKAQKFRSQEKNRADALERLKEIINAATTVQKTRKPTKPTRGSQKRRIDSKNKRGKVKSLRKKIDY